VNFLKIFLQKRKKNFKQKLCVIFREIFLKGVGGQSVSVVEGLVKATEESG
jgi:hypothetical protein